MEPMLKSKHNNKIDKVDSLKRNSTQIIDSDAEIFVPPQSKVGAKVQ